MNKNTLLRKQSRIILSAVAGTTVMTLYSYCVSRIQRRNFKEPVLLGKMLHRLLPWTSQNRSRVAGWVTHYQVGLLFAEMYAPFWSEGKMQGNIKTGLILGGLSGLAAILIWKFSLEMHPLPPAVHFIPFAGQLIIAHVIFGVAAAVAYTFTGHKTG